MGPIMGCPDMDDHAWIRARKKGRNLTGWPISQVAPQSSPYRTCRGYGFHLPRFQTCTCPCDRVAIAVGGIMVQCAGCPADHATQGELRARCATDGHDHPPPWVDRRGALRPHRTGMITVPERIDPSPGCPGDGVAEPYTLSSASSSGAERSATSPSASSNCFAPLGSSSFPSTR